jgi:hypothetical protein
MKLLLSFVAVSLLTLLAIEGVFRLLPAKDVAARIRHEFKVELQSGVFAPPASTKFHDRKVNLDTGLVIHDVEMTTDRFSRRLTPWTEARLHRARRHIVGLGCSFTWGQGVQPDQTWLAQLEKMDPELVTYNIAFGGYGPNDLIGRIDRLNALSEISPKRGMAVYLLIDPHIARFFHTTELAGDWGDKNGAVREDRPGEFQFEGPLRDVHPWFVMAQKFFFSSMAVRRLGLSLPVISNRDIDQFARSIAYIRARYRQATSEENRFVVVAYPSYRIRDSLAKAFQRERIELLDYSTLDLTKLTDNHNTIVNDQHPGPEAYAVLAKKIYQDLFTAPLVATGSPKDQSRRD